MCGYSASAAAVLLRVPVPEVEAPPATGSGLLCSALARCHAGGRAAGERPSNPGCCTAEEGPEGAGLWNRAEGRVVPGVFAQEGSGSRGVAAAMLGELLPVGAAADAWAAACCSLAFRKPVTACNEGGGVSACRFWQRRQDSGGCRKSVPAR